MKTVKITISILFGLVFGIWAMLLVNFSQMWASLQGAGYFYLFPMVAILFLSHWLRVLRWRVLLSPLASFRRRDLFSALMLGYMANTVMPAHLGEFMRAYVAGKFREIPGARIFSSIVVERILDMLAFLLLTALAVLLFPFPEWIVRGGYFILLFTGILALGLVLLKIRPSKTMRFLETLLTPFPKKVRDRLSATLANFLSGLNGLKNVGQYLRVILDSVLIWSAYIAIFWLGFKMFHLQNFELNWLSALVLVVITTIGVIIPNSPGYVGTYHKLCQLGLGLFGVPLSEGMSFAIVLHAVNFLPVIIAGLIVMLLKGWSFRKISKAVVSNA